MKKYGILLGTRLKNGRQIYVYMFRDIFTEIRYKHDLPNELVESLVLVEGLQTLNNYLEREIKSGA